MARKLIADWYMDGGPEGAAKGGRVRAILVTRITGRRREITSREILIEKHSEDALGGDSWHQVQQSRTEMEALALHLLQRLEGLGGDIEEEEERRALEAAASEVPAADA